MIMIISKIWRRFKSSLCQKIIFPLRNLRIELGNAPYIILTASVNPVFKNWGDDVSALLVSLINPRLKVAINRYSFNIFKKNDYLCIGSIISWMTGPKSIIWGSGVVYPEQKLQCKPLKVLAVRGPLTRNYLLEQGIECPPIYGDPALLFPRFYHPKTGNMLNNKKIEMGGAKYRIGIIPHFRDLNSPIIKHLSRQENVLIISVRDCNPWHRFIDRVCSCEYICSSSLHGIIMADAYSVPNTWIELESGERKRFAFQDYMQSVGRNEEKGYLVTQDTTIPELLLQCEHWKGIHIDLDLLYSVCPFTSM